MKTPSIKVIWSFLFLLLSIHTANAAETVLHCPAEISGSLIQMQAPSPEWQGYVEDRHLLCSAGFMSNEPSKLQILLPDSGHKIKDGYISTWWFEGDYPDGKWLICYYGNTGAFSLSKNIDEHFSKCSIIYKRNKERNSCLDIGDVEKIICQ